MEIIYEYSNQDGPWELKFELEKINQNMISTKTLYS